MSVSPSPKSRSAASGSPNKPLEKKYNGKDQSSSSRSRGRSNGSERRRSYSKGSDKPRGYRRQSGSPEDGPGNVLYITNISSRVKENKLEEKFTRFGNVNRVQIIKDPYSKFH